MMEASEELDVHTINKQLQLLRIKYSQLELKKKESDLGINKDLTELKSLRSIGKQWKDAAEVISSSTSKVTTRLDAEIDAINNKFISGVDEAEDAIDRSIKCLKRVNKVVLQQQKLIKSQQKELEEKTNRISEVGHALKTCQKELNLITDNTQAVADKICAPMREKVTETMFLIMKEKVIMSTL